MEYLEAIVNNSIIITAAGGWCCAQVLKTITHLIVHKKLVWERLLGDGGMPSSHSATVCGMAGAAFFTCGPASPEFGIALIIAIIVMHDASGVRLETGKQAVLLNKMMESFARLGDPGITAQERLKEFVGHTKLQVLMGGLLGILLSILINYR
ncbi:MAG: divergent PAP2 family protein [Lachnospiraceae bacterium]|nr:divergent PAP2 family protein [Lachnospiraceae bacterium]